MGSDFSKNLTASMGISLGGLEVVTDFLFTNPEFYESELAEVKNNVFGQTVKKQHYIKPVRPKKTREAILNKFSILQCVPVIQRDEILDIPNITSDDPTFDFSFEDDVELTINEVGNDEDILEANSLAQRIAEMGSSNISLSEDNTEEEDELDIEVGDIDDDIDIDTEEDDELDIEIEDEDSLDLDIDEEESEINDFEDNFEPIKNSEDTDDSDIDIEEDELDIEEDELDIEEDEELNIEDELDIEIEEDIDLDTEDDTDNIEDSFELDIDEDDKQIEIDISTEKTNNKSKVTNNQTVNNNEKPKTDKEIIKMQQKVAAMERQIQELKHSKPTESTHNKREVISDIDDIDRLLGNSKKDNTPKIDKYAQYSLMSIEALNNEVRNYLKHMGVQKRTVDLDVLNSKFGEINIRKLIQKSYLIKVGKGVTTGR